MSITLQLAEGQIYKEIIKSPIIYRGDHSKVRAKDHNGVSNPALKGLGLQE